MRPLFLFSSLFFLPPFSVFFFFSFFLFLFLFLFDVFTVTVLHTWNLTPCHENHHVRRRRAPCMFLCDARRFVSAWWSRGQLRGGFRKPRGGVHSESLADPKLTLCLVFGSCTHGWSTRFRKMVCESVNSVTSTEHTLVVPQSKNSVLTFQGFLGCINMGSRTRRSLDTLTGLMTHPQSLPVPSAARNFLHLCDVPGALPAHGSPISRTCGHTSTSVASCSGKRDL